MRSLLAASLALTASFLAAQSLTPPEQTTIKAVEANIPQEDALVEQLVNMNSGTKNLEGVRAVGNVLMPQFEALGFKVKWVSMDQVQRAGTLVAEHPCPNPGGCGKRLLLIGHMDTVFEKDSPFQHYTVNGTTGTGPGSSDMKGGLAIMLYALKAMQQAGALTNADITVVLSGDEEAAGQPTSISRRDMVDAAKHSDVALEFEGTAQENGIDYGSTSRRGAISWRIEASGKSAHSSGIFSDAVGAGAIYELARIIDTFRQQLPEHYLTYNVGLVLGGTSAEVNTQETGGDATGKPNIVAGKAIAIGDIRTISNEQAQRVEQKMQTIVAQHLPKTDATIKFYEGYPSMSPTEGNRALLKLMNGVNHDLELPDEPELDPLKRGAGDVSFVAEYVDALAGVGAVGTGAHAPGETIDLSAMPRLTKRAALLMERLTKIPQSEKLTHVAH